MRNQHILFILSSFNIGGAEIDVLNLANSLVKRNIKVTIFSDGGSLEKVLSKEVKLSRINVTSSNWIIMLYSMFRILAYCLLNRVTSVNPQSIRGVFLVGFTCKLLRLPLIATIHNIHHRGTLERGVALLNLLPSVVLFVSEFERQKFIQAGLNPHITKVMYSGIDLKKFPKAIVNKRKTRNIAMVGRLSPEKGIDIGIRAFGRICQEYPDTRLLIVGDGSCKPDLIKLAEKTAPNQIRFLGSRHDIPDFLKSIDFLLLPSFTESLSVVAREAMAAGKPVISSDVGGMKEIIHCGNNGILVPARDVPALSGAIQDLLDHSQKIQRFGEKARTLIESKFSITLWVSKMIALYRKAEGEMIPVYSSKKNILYLTTRFPFPKTKGDKLRAYHHIKELSKKHNIFLLTLTESEKDQQYFDQMRPYCKIIVPIQLNQTHSKIRRFLAHFSWVPSQIGYFYSIRMLRILPKLILANDIDTLFCQLIRGGQFAKKISNVWKVIDFVDAFSLNLKRNIKTEPFYRMPVYFIRMLKTFKYEQRMLKCFDKAIIISKTDKAALQNEEIEVIPNGVSQNLNILPIVKKVEKSIIFTGNMDYWPNEDAVTFLVEKIVPLIDKDIRIYLVGINNNPKVHKFASDRVTVTGHVKSIFEAIQKATVAVCPMRLGAGQQNKVLEAMAAGVPVVLTSVANSGISATDCVLESDDPAEFASYINRLMKDPNERLILRNNALNFIKSQYHWPQLVNQMQEVLWKETSTSTSIMVPELNQDFTKLTENRTLL